MVNVKTDAMFSLLLAVACFFLKGCAAQCEPGFADTCFTSVQSDLNFMLNLPHTFIRNISQAALNELCVAIDDSLECTTDIIDWECTEEEGKLTLDSWVTALRAAYLYLCSEKHGKLKDLLFGIRCWNIDTFFSCTKESTCLDSIADLLHTPLDPKECRKLRNNIKTCYEIAKKGSCREQENVKNDFLGMTQAFMGASHCEHVSTAKEDVTSTPLCERVNVTMNGVLLSSASGTTRQGAFTWFALAVVLGKFICRMRFNDV